MPETAKHPPFSLRASWRETTAFAAGFAAMVGAFGPWLHLSGTVRPIMGDPRPFTETVWGGATFGAPVAVLCALAIAAAFAPLPTRVRAGVRATLFGLALSVLGVAVWWFLMWGDFHIFRRTEQVRVAWGLWLTGASTLVAFAASLSRLLAQEARPSPAGPDAAR